MYEFIKVETRNRVGFLTLNRPERLNAWHKAMREEFVAALTAFNDDDGVGAVVITGAGNRAFCAGQDINDMKQFKGEDGPKWIDEWEKLWTRVMTFEKGLVGAFNGAVAGSAFQTSLLFDVRVAHPAVQMGVPEINIGIPMITAAWILWDTIGKSTAVDLTLTGRMIDAVDAYRLGIVHHVVPEGEVMGTATTIAEDLASKSPSAMRTNKRFLWERRRPEFQEILKIARETQRQTFSEGGAQKRMASFLEQGRG